MMCSARRNDDIDINHHKRPENLNLHFREDGLSRSGGKIANMATGWLAGQAARDFTATDEKMLSHFDIEDSEEFKTTKYFCKTHFDMARIKEEESNYVELPTNLFFRQ